MVTSKIKLTILHIKHLSDQTRVFSDNHIIFVEISHWSHDVCLSFGGFKYQVFVSIT